MFNRKLGLSIILFAAICAGAAVVYFTNNSIENKLDRYFKEKYEIEVVLVDEEEWNTGNMGDLTHTVAVKGNKNIKFNVFESGGEITGDTYHRGLDAYEQYKKLEPLLPEIQALGFGEPPFGNYLEYIREVAGEYNLKFSREGKLDSHSFEEEEFNDFFQLVQLIDQSEINVKGLRVYYTKPEDDPGDIYFAMKDLNEPTSEEEVKELLRVDNWDLKNAYISEAYDEALAKAENERFRFGAVYEDDWLLCRNIYPITGYCSPYEAHVAYPQKEFQPGSPLLAEDLERARKILTELLPKDSEFEIVLAGVEDVEQPKKNNDTIDFKRITIERDDWNKYDSMKSLLEAKFKEQGA
ncbi:hypothetical protein J7I93_04240 [Bacillus sp. ISL-47]|uniref:hypothetical protein n=1 Tax=Bacillus sp. ISL-47 TaxID=2819130 RepID=UPI001BE9F54F|nr:hypothetical protein [Bacillus sp. ISL-47]MBT2687387.1 hypothetical protein [Bacillus sp. ISL-47]MBT2707151.1 hypothetical protein [Pseudomonas sp. ISL-84]